MDSDGNKRFNILVEWTEKGGGEKDMQNQLLSWNLIQSDIDKLRLNESHVRINVQNRIIKTKESTLRCCTSPFCLCTSNMVLDCLVLTNEL